MSNTHVLSPERLAAIEADVKEHLAPKPKRLAHVLSVADTAEHLAQAYGVDSSLARAAGLLHDWDKLDSDKRLLERARALNIDVGVELELIAPVLHGLISEIELPTRYPDLPPEVFSAIGKHTVGGASMSPLDMVLLVADIVEPLRPDREDIQELRSLIDNQTELACVCKRALAISLIYVLATGRYLWTKSVENYNAFVIAHA